VRSELKLPDREFTLALRARLNPAPLHPYRVGEVILTFRWLVCSGKEPSAYALIARGNAAAESKSRLVYQSRPATMYSTPRAAAAAYESRSIPNISAVAQPLPMLVLGALRLTLTRMRRRQRECAVVVVRGGTSYGARPYTRTAVGVRGEGHLLFREHQLRAVQAWRARKRGLLVGLGGGWAAWAAVSGEKRR
jgi:hypothetical protein